MRWLLFVFLLVSCSTLVLVFSTVDYNSATICQWVGMRIPRQYLYTYARVISVVSASFSHLSLSRLISSLEERSNINFCTSLDLSSSSNSCRLSRINSSDSDLALPVSGLPKVKEAISCYSPTFYS